MGASYDTTSPLCNTQANVVTAHHHVMQDVPAGYNAEAVETHPDGSFSHKQNTAKSECQSSRL